jgi:hypothetical protein
VLVSVVGVIVAAMLNLQQRVRWVAQPAGIGWAASHSSSVGLLVLHDDVGGYAATLTDLQASCPGPFTHRC